MNVISKLPLKKIGIAIIVLLNIRCTNKSDIKTFSTKGIFNGLYTVNYKGYDKEYVWIFTENIRYMLYPTTNSEFLNPLKNIGYETPTHYYVKNNNFYSCGIESNMKATPLDKCKKENYAPRYNIISIDTILEYSSYEYQKIVLKDHLSKSKERIILKKQL
ncbi:hypothetical protein [Aquimarina rhabdastrellae]